MQCQVTLNEMITKLEIKEHERRIKMKYDLELK